MVLAVDKNHRRKGIASKLVRWGAEEAAKDGKTVVLLSAPDAALFYTAVGFEVTGKAYISGYAHNAMRMLPAAMSGSATV